MRSRTSLVYKMREISWLAEVLLASQESLLHKCGWLVGWLVVCSFVCLFVCLFGLLVARSVGLSVDRSVSYMLYVVCSIWTCLCLRCCFQNNEVMTKAKTLLVIGQVSSCLCWFDYAVSSNKGLGETMCLSFICASFLVVLWCGVFW